MQLARDYARNYLYEDLSVAEFNRVRFDFPSVIETNFPLVLNPSGTLDPEEIEKARETLSSRPQLSLVWELDEPGRCVVFCGTGKGDLTGWTINFAGKMKTEELDAGHRQYPEDAGKCADSDRIAGRGGGAENAAAGAGRSDGKAA